MDGDQESSAARRPAKHFTPRGYQTEVFRVAALRNTIAVLDTGAGKTLIAVMLIADIGSRLCASGGKPLIFFLAPTVPLVKQQYEVIRDYTAFEVGEYYGDKGMDEWSAECWEKEIDSKEIMVMTPQILLDALRNAFLMISRVHLMVFDECHRACGSHPYTKIMKEFYHISESKPSIFGMTASPVARKGVSSAIDCEAQLSELESLLDSKVYLVVDRSELEACAPSAVVTNIYYDANNFYFKDVKMKVECVFAKIDNSLGRLQDSPSNQFKDTNDILKTSRMTLSRYHRKILYCLDNFGLICAVEATRVCIENVQVLYDAGECDFLRSSHELHISFLEETLHILEESLPHDYERLLNVESEYLEGINLGFVSPKFDKLLQIFQSFGLSEVVLCLIFVERIITAKVIERLMKKISNLSHFSISYLTGGNSSKDALTSKNQRTTLDLFRYGKVNLLFTTDVAEEGIHIPNCSCVIRFDLPKTVRSFVQSRGRARQNNSLYILMIERGNTEQGDQIFSIFRSELSVMDTALSRDPTTCIPKLRCENLNVYRVQSTGATVTPDASISLVYKYCEKLPKDRYFIPKPNFEVLGKHGSYKCVLTLPPNAVFRTLVGPLSISSSLAMQLAAVEACKKLHELGALSDNLLPGHENFLEDDISGRISEYAYGAGTTKRKELHGTTRAHALSGRWAHKPDDVTLNAYKLNFVCDQEGENYSGFLLLIESTLDYEVASAEVELYLFPNKVVQAFVSPCGPVKLNVDQVEKSKLFQEFFFNGIFGKLFTGSRLSGERREFLFSEGNKIPWSSLNMYLLLPFDSLSRTSNDSPSIHWDSIDACASAVAFLRSIYSEDREAYFGFSFTVNSKSRETGCQQSDIIHLANKSLHMQNLKDSVVMAIHTGRIYTVLDVVNTITPESSLDEIDDAKSSGFISFIEYYYQKYNIVLQYPAQPLILLKQSHNPHNLLLSKLKFEDDSSNQNILTERAQIHAHIPPELLVHIDISNDILKSFYLLPSVLHRLESLMLASQLRGEIYCNCSSAGSQISSYLILEALTTRRCCENLSLERMELLGDSVLKYALGCHLFLRYPKKHEGQLSDHRTQAVCNATLHKLGTDRFLQGYIRDSPFDPRRWVAPGQISLRRFPCTCGIDTPQVPLEVKYVTEETSVVVGKMCDEGHRWMCSKTIADCVEALVGAFYVGGGLVASVSLMRWLGLDANFDMRLVNEVKMNASHLCSPKLIDIESLESELEYSFSVKGLLLEAITHPSQQELGIEYCYQRLEFLGDSVLDLLITWYLFVTHQDIDPGELTDLRSASVSNENFARAAVRGSLHRHLQHGSGLLSEKITEYVNLITEFDENDDFLLSLGGPRGPKVLGDIVESIAGAVLIDTDLNLDKVWEVLEPLLSPIITPDNLAFPPLRELIELCSNLGYFIKTKCSTKGEEFAAELTVQLKDDLLVGHGCNKNTKAAKAEAALCLLKDLRERGISHTRSLSKRISCEDKSFEKPCISSLRDEISLPQKFSGIVGPNSTKSPMPETSMPFRSDASSFLTEEACHSEKLSNPKVIEKVDLSVRMQKGGARSALFDLCKILQWPAPKFETTEEKFRTPIIVSGIETRHFNIFVSTITLHIPKTAVIRLVGEQKTDKRRSQDSAAMAMLLELQKQGRCAIREQFCTQLYNILFQLTGYHWILS